MMYKPVSAAAIIPLGLIVLLLILSCAGAPHSAGGNKSSSGPRATSDAGESGGPESGESKSEEVKRPPVIEVSGRIDFSTSPYRELLTTVPEKGNPRFFTAVPRMGNREDEFNMGLMLLARQAAMHYKASVTAKFLTQSNNRDMGYKEQVDVEIDKDLVQSMVDKIEITAHYRDVQGSYFQGFLKGNTLPRFSVSREIKHNAPAWFTDLPVFDEYITAVGTAQRHMFIAESFLHSDRQALAALGKQLDIEVKQRRDDMEVEYKGSAYQQLNLEISDTVVKGFYVLDRWVSKDGNTYYSLAVCPK